jgi:phosphinothricin acetyltransferase
MIRKAEFKDLINILEIYNQAIEKRFQTAHQKPKSLDEMGIWWKEHNASRWPVFVIELADRVVGYVSLSAYRSGREAFAKTAEVSYYLHADFQNGGLGGDLMQYAIRNAPEFGFKYLIAILLSENTPSIRLLVKYGFKEWGRMPGIAHFENMSCDHLYYGLALKF